MSAKQPIISDDTSIKQFMQDVVIPKLESLETAVSTLITKDALELALLKEREATRKSIEDAITTSESNAREGRKNRVWFERAFITAILYLLGNNLVGILSNIGRTVK